MNKLIKQIAKKLYKTGLYTQFYIKKDHISFKNCNNVTFSFDLRHKLNDIPNTGLFRAGYVVEFTSYEPTFESEYSVLGNVDKAVCNAFFESYTDNSNFILRNANFITLGI